VSAEDFLADLDLPVTLIGCQLLEGTHPRTFDIESKGPLGGEHGTLFFPRGDTAMIIAVGKKGWFGSRRQNTPIERHVEVLREIGFHRMMLPNDKEYEIREGWPGVKRIRD
jgi:hypothetical protein